MMEEPQRLSVRWELAAALSAASLIFFLGLFPILFSLLRVNLPPWAAVLLAAVPIQLAYIASSVWPARHCEPQKSLAEALDLKMLYPQEIAAAVSGTLGVYIGIVLITGAFTLLLKFCGIPVQPQETVEILRNGEPSAAAALIPTAIFLAPIGEELCFRSALQKVFDTLAGPRYGAWLTAMLFGIVHLNLAAFPALCLLSLWLTFLYRKTGSLAAAMLAHAVFNGLSVLLVCLMPANPPL